MPQSEDTISIALSLLKHILTSSLSRENSENKDRFESIAKNLDYIGKRSDLQASKTAQNLLTVLEFQEMIEEPAADASILTGEY